MATFCFYFLCVYNLYRLFVFCLIFAKKKYNRFASETKESVSFFSEISIRVEFS